MVSSEDSKPVGLRLPAAGHGGQGAPPSARQVDEVQWKQNCIDLHQVMNVVKSVYLTLEHHNEALVRVAVELCTCPVGRKVLWWNDAWPGDFQKREDLRELVKEKLALAIAHVKNTKPVFETKDLPDFEEVEELRQKLREAEMAKQAAQHQQQVAELRCREAEQAAEEDRKQLEALGTSINTLRAQLRAQMEAPVDTSMQDKVAELEAKLKLSEQQCGMLSQKLGDTEHKLKASEEAQINAQKALQEAQEELKRRSMVTPPAPVKAPPREEEPKQIVKEVIPQKLLDKHKKELQALKDEVEEAQTATKKAEAERDEALANLKSLQADLERERKRSQELEAASKSQKPTVVTKAPEVQKRDASAQVNIEVAHVDTSTPIIEGLRSEVEEANRRAQELEQRLLELQNRPPPAPPPPPEPKVERPKTPPPPVIKGPSKEEKEELEALRKIAADYDKALAKLTKRDEQIAKLKEEKAAWEEEKMRLLRALHQLKDQLRRVQEIAEKKGYGKLVEDIMSEAQVIQTLNSPEWSCFDRLYEDALRRQKKQNNIAANRHYGSEKERPRGVYLGTRTMGTDGALVNTGQQQFPTPVPDYGYTQSASGYHSPPNLGPYRSHPGSGYVTGAPCPRCGFTANGHAGTSPTMGMTTGGGSGASSPRSQVERGSPGRGVHSIESENLPIRMAPVPSASSAGGIFKARLSIDSIDEYERQPDRYERQPDRAASTGRILKDDAHSPGRTPAMLADLPVRPVSMQHLQQRAVGPTPPPLAIGITPPTSPKGTANSFYSPNRAQDVNMRNRSRSPIDVMLQQKAAALGNQAFPKMVHSKSEPRELPRLHSERPAFSDFSNGGINTNNAGLSPLVATSFHGHTGLKGRGLDRGHDRGDVWADRARRLHAARGPTARERSLSSEKKNRTKRALDIQDFALAGLGDGIVGAVGGFRPS